MNEEKRCDEGRNEGAIPNPGINQQNIPIYEPRKIMIKKVLNGYIVEVGCKIVVFEQRQQMLLEINRYYENPMVVEKEYMEKYGC